MSCLGIDCAAPLTAITAARAKAAGFAFVGRYLVEPSVYAKALTKSEAAAVCSAGLRILSVWETTADRVRGGAEAGSADGRRALACARAIGMPENGVIYFAVDYGAPKSDMGRIASYLIAATSQIKPYRAGVYGSFDVVEHMAANGVCEHFWQCVAWSNGKKSKHLSVYQRLWSGATEAKAAAAKIGVSVDINDCPDMDRAGLWTYEEDEGNMTGKDILDKLTDEQAWLLVEKANRHAAGLKPSEYAMAACEKGVKSGLFSDGDRDGLVDNPQSYLKRQELAAVLDRKGLLG